MPSCLKTAVRRAVPAKISTQKRLFASLPAHLCCTGEKAGVQGSCGDGFCHECCCKLWGLWHPGSAHKCMPRSQWPPGAASRHPVVMLKGQQRR